MVSLRAGSYNAAEPDYHGTLSDGTWQVYECHDHHVTREEARSCARKAHAYLTEHGYLPPEWDLTPQQRAQQETRPP